MYSNPTSISYISSFVQNHRPPNHERKNIHQYGVNHTQDCIWNHENVFRWGNKKKIEALNHHFSTRKSGKAGNCTHRLISAKNRALVGNPDLKHRGSGRKKSIVQIRWGGVRREINDANLIEIWSRRAWRKNGGVFLISSLSFLVAPPTLGLKRVSLCLGLAFQGI